ncbi:MAG TPA: acetyl-coenzyme A synthetase N-terminal domain-containing protein, partial [Pseudonocardiaceae bacterium]|nr:acetyl-coenzyme A synthetase N-terminal domain-containing protein [Pseudonocardiaceae bacterium]
MTEPSGQGAALDNLLTESRTFPPSEEFAAQANATAQLYADAEDDRDAFWAAQADHLHWDTRWSQVLDWSNAPFAKWFVGGRLNVA